MNDEKLNELEQEGEKSLTRLTIEVSPPLLAGLDLIREKMGLRSLSHTAERLLDELILGS